VARTDHRADEVLLVAARGGRLDSDEALAAVRAGADPVQVEKVVVDAEAPMAPSGS
jgi:hypothetical protein